MLDKEQIEQYHRDGYLAIKSVIPAAMISKLRVAATGIVDDFDIDQHRTVFSTNNRDAGRDDYFFDSAEAVHCFLEEGAVSEQGELLKPKELAINKFGHAMHDLVPEFTDFCRLPLFADLLHAIGYRQPQLWQSMYIFKQPHIGGEVRWHQDASYLITEPSGVTGIWIALEQATRENGCLKMQPGQHRSPLRELYQVDWQQREGVLTSLNDTPWCKEGASVALEVPVGSVVLFNDHMPHYSSPNTSANSRHAFTMHVAEQSAKWSEKNWLQRKNLPDFLL